MKIIYIDMANVLVDFPFGIEKLKEKDSQSEKRYTTDIWDSKKKE